MIRPIIGEDGESFLSYYLTSEDAEAITYNTRRQAGHTRASRAQNPLLPDLDEDDDDNEERAASFKFIRDYETVKIDTDVPNEFLLVLDDGSSLSAGGTGGKKGAYYKNIERKYVLRKRRANVRLIL